MKLAMMLPVKKNIQWDLALQVGVTHAVTKAAPELSGLPAPFDFDSLKTIKQSFDKKGLTLYALEGDEFNMDRIKLGLPGKDEDIEKYCKMLKNMGKLGLKLLCYNFMGGIGWFRTKRNIIERGGALTSGFDIADIGKTPLIITPEEMWENYTYFIKSVMPYAEKAGVKMALHPDDPPIPNLLGYSRIFIDANSYRRAMSIVDSPSHGITFCQATFKAMGENVFELIKEWKTKIFFFHFRDIEGNANCFHETFHDNGPTDMAKYLKLADEFSPDSIIRADHTPTMAGEDNKNLGYNIYGNIFAAGYIRGLAEGQKILIE